MKELEKIKEKVKAGERLTPKEGLLLFKLPLHDLGALAREVRFRLNPQPIVTYVVDRNINYTNVCISGCKFCAFFAPPNSPKAFLLSFEEIAKKIEETLALARWALIIEEHYGRPMDIEWASLSTKNSALFS